MDTTRTMFGASTYATRRRLLRNKIKTGVAIFMGNNDSPMNYTDNTYRFRQDSTFIYFFGIWQPGIMAAMDFDSGEEIIFADEYSIDDIVWMGKLPTMRERALLAGITTVKPVAEAIDYVHTALRMNRNILFTPQYRADSLIKLSKMLNRTIDEVANGISMELTQAIIDLRSIKSAEEIEEMEFACAIGYEMHVAAMKNVMRVKNEYELHSIVDSIPLKYGGYFSFPTILTQNGQTLHNHYHGNPIQPGRLMLVDAGAETAMGYPSDYTRTFPVNGKFTQKQKDIYQIVLDANQATVKLAKPGITYLSVHLACCKIIAQGLKNIGLMKGDVDEAVAAGAHAMFLPHGLGHMIGLDVHDMENLGQIYVGYDQITRPIDQFGTSSLRMGRTLQPGFVVSDEPGIYFIPDLISQWKAARKNAEFINFDKVEQYIDFGGVRIEDDILITETGARVLGDKKVPSTIEEVEQTVQNG